MIPRYTVGPPTEGFYPVLRMQDDQHVAIGSYSTYTAADEIAVALNGQARNERQDVSCFPTQRQATP